MGQGQSGKTSDGDGGTTAVSTKGASAQTAGASLDEVAGFQVVRVLPQSPAHRAGMVPYFDLITALDHISMNTEEMSVFGFFRTYMYEHQDRSVCFTLYNLHLRSYRDVQCTPTTSWGGGGLLGCSVEWSRASRCVEQSWHVIDVLEGSPASHCPDIHPGRDYIIGMQQPEEPLISLLKSEQDMYSRLEMWHSLQRSAINFRNDFHNEAVVVPHSLLFMLYDSEANAVKEVVVEMGTELNTPLGVRIASGLLHHIPFAPASDVAQLPAITQFVLISESGISLYKADRVPLLAEMGEQPKEAQLSPANIAPAPKTTAVVAATPASSPAPTTGTANSNGAAPAPTVLTSTLELPHLRDGEVHNAPHPTAMPTPLVVPTSPLMPTQTKGATALARKSAAAAAASGMDGDERPATANPFLSSPNTIQVDGVANGRATPAQPPARASTMPPPLHFPLFTELMQYRASHTSPACSSTHTTASK